VSLKFALILAFRGQLFPGFDQLISAFDGMVIRAGKEEDIDRSLVFNVVSPNGIPNGLRVAPDLLSKGGGGNIEEN
jgi:hypothetical protein